MSHRTNLYKVMVEYVEDFDKWSVTIFYADDVMEIKLCESATEALFYALENQRVIHKEEEPK